MSDALPLPTTSTPTPTSTLPPTPTPTPRLIAHLDMDAFFASVELLRHPALAGEAVVIGGGSSAAPETLPDGSLRYRRLREYAGRGVVTTATYAARAFGIHSAMGMMKAAALAPDAVLLPTDFEEYRRCSRAFKAAVRAFGVPVEDRGIDELYIDLSGLPDAQADGGRSTGLALKAAVRAATGLVCSVGIAPNKLLAKIGSDLDKPDGLTLLAHVDLPNRIWPLPASKINGIGPKAAARLRALGIGTIGDLAAAQTATLLTAFGANTTAWLQAVAHGRDERPVVTEHTPKSVSRETTFGRDLHAVADRAELSARLTALCDRLAADLARKGVVAGTIGIKLRYTDFRRITRDRTLPEPTQDAATLRRAAGSCLKRVDLVPRFRLLGVRASGLRPVEATVAATPRRRQAGQRPVDPTIPLFDDAVG